MEKQSFDDVSNQATKDLFNMCVNSFWPINSYDRIRDLLVKGARVNDADDKDRTPLMFICWKYRRSDISTIIELLFSFQADVKRMDRFGWNALHFSCRFNMTPHLLQIVEVLLRNHIDIDQTTRNGWNCLHYLCKYNTNERLKDIVIAFIDRRIDVNAQTKTSKDTALHLLCRYCRCMDFQEIFQILINRGARINVKTRNRKTIFHLLCKYGIELDLSSIIAYLVRNIRPEELLSLVEKRDYCGSTALIYAARIGCTRTIQHFLKINAEMCIIYDPFGKNALDYLLEIGENRSSPLCECCDEVDFEVLKSLENEVNKFDVSRRKNVSFPEIRVDELENRIPRRIDNGFTNSTRDAHISVPLGSSWKDMKNAWNKPDNKSFKIGPFLTFIDENTHKITCRSEDCHWCIVSSTVEQFLRKLTKKITKFDPRFAIDEIVYYGSSAENCKLLQPDEFDYMVILSKFQESATIEGKVNYAAGNNLRETECFLGTDGKISSAHVLYYFYLLLVNAIERVEYFKILVQDVSYGETCVTLHLIYRGNSPVLTRLKISVDITIGVARSYDFLENTISKIPRGFYPKSIRYKKKYKNAIVLVPNRRKTSDNNPQGPILGGLWKPSFPSLERRALLKMGSAAVKCYCLFKLFVLLTTTDDSAGNGHTSNYITIDSFGSPDSMDRKTKPSSYELKTCVLRCIEKKPELLETNNGIDNNLNAIGIAKFGLAVCHEFLDHYENNTPLLSFFDDTLTINEIKLDSQRVMQTIKERLELSVRHADDEKSKEANRFRFKNIEKCCAII